MEFLLNLWKNENLTLKGSNYSDNEAEPLHTAEDLSRDMTKAVLPVTLLIAVEAVFGVVGNVFILIVYYKWYKICSFRSFVLCMACIDLTSSLTTLPGEIYSQVNWYSYPYDAVCKAKSFFNVFTVWATGLILLLLAYDRYRKICHPLSWQIPVRTSGRLCFSGVLFAVVISSPTAVFWGKQSYEYIDGNISIPVSICEKADSYAYDLVPFVYILCAFVTPMFLIMSITATFNICTGRKLLIGLRRERDETNHPNCSMLPAENDERSFQFSTPEHDNKNLSQYDKHSRRFSFPAGKLSLKRRLIIKRLTHLRLNGSHLANIPETSTDSIYNPNQNTEGIFPERKVKLKRGKFFSDSDVVDPRRSLTRLNQWQNNYIRHRFCARRRKTLIMLVLSGVFIVTMSLYLGLVCKVANTEGVLRELSNSEKVVFFFFWRMYFINCLINPLLYGFMDHRFRKGLVRLLCTRPYFLRSTNTSVF